MKRFFNDTSFWNQPIGPNHAIDPASHPMLDFLAKHDDRGFWLNLNQWTIPIYEVDASTPRRRIHRRFHPGSPGCLARSTAYLHAKHPFGHGRDFAADAEAGLIPIPAHARPDPESDSHIALVDWQNGWIWDMWAVRIRPDGEWECNSGMKYRADGSGVFDRAEFTVHNGESIHPYGPARAAGVPILAGTIMHDDVVAGVIPHKLAFATQCSALQRFVNPPACWTDGGWDEGLPEGAVVQLDPALNLETLGLSPAAKVIARALQDYGAVNVDVCGGHSLYGEGLYADPLRRTWDGLLDGNALIDLKFEHYRVLKMDGLVHEGMGRREKSGIYGHPAPTTG
ncbi:hypothetical protein [Rariglobus hedericola]|uniref:Uncharacterized protein n=1 Tax=Rariglobus hedericola TaxID=2597822 RepID=A0A556QKY9_9BACT|nr:hypothetical protein [Rariglobus hedericola]TSJ77298.1 hypothetical protein FPL22_14480 [Rariglobus hedericola]